MLIGTLDEVEFAPEYPELVGKRVFVTGVSGPLGIDVVRAVAEAGARLVVQADEDGPETQAMAEMWRVLKPGGIVRLTTNIARRPRVVTINRAIYGEASERTDDGAVFFERHYDDGDLDRRLLALPWEVVRRDRVRQVNPRIEARYHRLAPASYLLGNALPLVSARNFAPVASTDDFADGEMGVVSLELRKPEHPASG